MPRASSAPARASRAKSRATSWPGATKDAETVDRRLQEHLRAGRFLPRDRRPRHPAAEARSPTELLKYGKQFGLKIVATNDVHYVRKEHAAAHDVLLCIQTGAKINDENRMRYTGPEFYLKTTEEMAALFRDVPEALATTLEIAEKCDLKIVLGENKFPAYTRAGGRDARGLSAPPLLRGARAPVRRAREGTGVAPAARLRAGRPEQDRLHQLLPHRLGFHRLREDATAFRSGRGAAARRAASSPTCSASPISIRSSTAFSSSASSIRSAFRRPISTSISATTARPEVIEYVRKKYGEKSVAQIITFGTLGAKMAIRDVGRVMGLSYGEADRLAKMIPFDPEDDAGKGARGKPRLQARLRRGGDRAHA